MAEYLFAVIHQLFQLIFLTKYSIITTSVPYYLFPPGGALTFDIGTPIAKPSHLDSTPHNTTTHNINMGGSVILPAASAAENNNNMASEAYNELLQKYRRMEYENSQLLFKVTEMNRQLQGQKVICVFYLLD